jgi:hypothetical protein
MVFDSGKHFHSILRQYWKERAKERSNHSSGREASSSEQHGEDSPVDD